MTAAPPVREGRLARLGLVVRAPDRDGRHRLARIADLAGFDVVWIDQPATAADLADTVVRARVLVRPPVDEPWARTLPVSIGRTTAEAAARLELDPTMAAFGDPRLVGLYGTLETCQQTVIALAHAGIVDLRCVVPQTPDVHDLVAQLTAVVIGQLGTHRPDAPRSADPAAPPWAARRPEPARTPDRTPQEVNHR